jgi:hypothetical protein
MCSLAANQPAAAMAPPFLFALAMTVGTGLMIGMMEEASGPALWLLTAVLIPASAAWTRHQVTAASVAARFLAIHLLFCSIATFWTWDWNSHREEFPLALMHSAFLTIVNLDKRFITNEITRNEAEVAFAIPLYWCAMLANFVWARRWMIQNFDRLVGKAAAQAPFPLALPSPQKTEQVPQPADQWSA